MSVKRLENQIFKRVAAHAPSLGCARCSAASCQALRFHRREEIRHRRSASPPLQTRVVSPKFFKCFAVREPLALIYIWWTLPQWWLKRLAFSHNSSPCHQSIFLTAVTPPHTPHTRRPASRPVPSSWQISPLLPWSAPPPTLDASSWPGLPRRRCNCLMSVAKVGTQILSSPWREEYTEPIFSRLTPSHRQSTNGRSFNCAGPPEILSPRLANKLQSVCIPLSFWSPRPDRWISLPFWSAFIFEQILTESRLTHPYKNLQNGRVTIYSGEAPVAQIRAVFVGGSGTLKLSGSFEIAEEGGNRGEKRSSLTAAMQTPSAVRLFTARSKNNQRGSWSKLFWIRLLFQVGFLCSSDATEDRTSWSVTPRFRVGEDREIIGELRD